MRSNPAKPPKRSKEIAVTVVMMEKMEGRLIHKINGFRDELKAEIHGIKSEIHGMKSELHRVALLMEEQNARNKYVMDGYAQIYELLTRITP